MATNGSGYVMPSGSQVIPRVVAIGLNHGLCVSKSLTFNQTKARGDAQKEQSGVVDATLHVHSWGNADFNCLGHGIKVKLAKLPQSIKFFERKNVSQVACGDYHSAVLVLPQHAKTGTGGTVYTFGLGSGGRLGYFIDDEEEKNFIKRAVTVGVEPSWCTAQPNPVGLAVNLKNCVVSLSCGANHTIITTVDGSLFSWGMGAYGVLGTGNTDNQFTPVRVEFPLEDTIIAKCAAGCRHSFGLDNLGRVWAWGYGGNGRLGIGNTRTHYSPMMVKIQDGCKVVQISCGDVHSACIDEEGNVYTWGSSKGGKLGHAKSDDDILVPTMVTTLSGIRIVQVECGTGVTLALSEGGSIYQWGCILGVNPALSDAVPRISHHPQEVMDAGSKNIFIAAGPYSCAAVNVYGDLKTWGVGSSFRLGHGHVGDCPVPKFVPELRTKIYVDALLANSNKFGVTREEEHTESVKPANTFNEKRIQQVSAGMSHGALVTCSGTMYTWGANGGIGFSKSEKPGEVFKEPRLLQHFSTKIKRIACGSNHTLAVTASGMAFSWGCNDSGELGLGDLRPRAFPEHLSTLEYVINVFAGYNNSCCITTTKHDNFINDEVGSAWVFGSASGGKLGLGEGCTASSIMNPRKLTYISGVYKVALGNSHSLLLQFDGTLYATGSGANGRTGTGENAIVNEFKRVNTDLKFIDIAVGSSHSLAVSMDNDLYGWGKGKSITMNDESILQPTRIEGLPCSMGVTKVIAVSAMYNHSFVVTDQGGLIAWGDNSSGQLGVPLMTDSAEAREFIKRPSIVVMDCPVTSVSTSRTHTICTTVKGDSFAWGTASDGRLGIGDTHDKIVYKPTPMATINLMCDMLDNFENMKLSNDSLSYISRVESFMNELHFRDNKDVVDWKNLQIILKNEERLCWESSLKSFEDDLVSCLKQHVDFILEMGSYQSKLDSLRFRLKVAVKGFVNNLGGSRPHIKELAVKSVQQYRRFIKEIERIVEIVFLQPSYFVRLCLFGDDYSTVEAVVKSLYSRLDVPRVHNQFVALVLTLLREDIQLFFNPQTPLNASCSPFSRILRAYATTKYISEANASIFYSNEFQNSFANFLNQGRLILPNEAQPNGEELKRFGEFIIHLNQMLRLLEIPYYVRLAMKRMHDYIKFRIPPWCISPNVLVENVAIYPIIPVFVYAILQPYFSDANTLAALHGYDIANKEVVLNNFSVVSQYLDYIVNPCLTMEPSAHEEVNRATMTLYRNLSHMLLEYIKTLLDVEDTFNIDVTMETFKSHFDTEKLRVEVPSYLIAQFVNNCVTTKKYLNLSAHDPLSKTVEELLKAVGKETQGRYIFTEATIEQLKHMRMVCRVGIEHRFMTYEKNMSICKFSGVFLPQRLAYRQSTYSEDCVKFISLIVRYVPFAKYDPPRIIQNALVELQQLDITPGGFDELGAELERMAGEHSSPETPDYMLAAVARNTYSQVMKIDRSRSNPSDIVSAILTKVMERYHQRRYLLRIYRRQGEIEACKSNFEAEFREKVEYLSTCIDHAVGMFMEPCIQKAALTYRVKLHRAKCVARASESKRCSVRFNLSVLCTNGEVICKREEDIKRLSSLSLVLTFHHTSGCTLVIEERAKGGYDPITLESHQIPMSMLEACSEDVSESFYTLLATSTHPQGLLDIRNKFLVESFMELMASLGASKD